MKANWLRGLGLVLASGVVWALLLWPVRYYQPVIPFPFGLFAMVLAAGLPAFFAAALAYRWRLPQPVVWAGAGYCLGSGIATAILMGPGETPGRYLQVAAAHAASLTALMPEAGGGLGLALGNLLWLAAAVIVGMYGIDAYRGPARSAASPDTPSPPR